MSTNSNLEIKVSELTNVIRNLSDKPLISTGDINEILNNLVQRVEDANLEGFDKLTGDVSESLISALEEKYADVKERLSLFETFIASVEKTVQSPKLDSEITQILNDIEALHSKMNSQELQIDALIKSFDSMKNVSSTRQITKLCDEIVAISKSYDGIAEVLNNNFQEFLRRVEALSSRDEFQRLRYLLETIEGSQNVIVSVMNAVNDKQEEIKNLIKNSSVQNPEKFDSLQAILNQMNGLLVETSSKADIESVADKISRLFNLFNEFKRIIENNNENDFRSVFQSQLNNIISKLEGMKLDNTSNVNEDIIRLYTSIAEFKDGVYSSVTSQMNDVIALVDAQLDKISSSAVNATLDSTESVNNLSGEVQKLSSLVFDGFNSKTSEIKDDIQKASKENALTIVNSIKGELAIIKNEISSLNNSDANASLISKIETIQTVLDFDSLIAQISQIKETLNLEPIKKQLEGLNQNEIIKSINLKADLLFRSLKNAEVLAKLDELESIINPKDLHGMLDAINRKIEAATADNLGKAEINKALNGIKNKIESMDLKLGENDASRYEEMTIMLEELDGKMNILDIKLGEKDNPRFDDVDDALNQIDNKIGVIDLKLDKNDDSKFEKMDIALNGIDNKISAIDAKVSQKDSSGLDDIAERIETLVNFIKTINTNNRLSGRIDELEKGILNAGDSRIKELREEIIAFQNDITDNFELLQGILENLPKNEIDAPALALLFGKCESRLAEKITKISALMEKTTQNSGEKTLNNLKEALEKAKNELNEAFKTAIESTVELKTEFINESLKNELTELKIDITNYFKQETNTLSAAIEEKNEKAKNELNEAFKTAIESTVELKTEFINESLKNELSGLKTGFIEHFKTETSSLSAALSKKSENLNNELLAKITEIFSSENNSPIKPDLIKDISEMLAEVSDDVSKFSTDDIRHSLDELVYSFGLLSSNFEKSSDNNALLQNKMEENRAQISESIDEANKKIDEVKNELAFGANRTIDELKTELQELKTSLWDRIENRQEMQNIRDELMQSIEQEIQAKILPLRDQMKDSASKLDSSTNELKTKLENKTDEIQRELSEKIYEIISKNNDIIKDEIRIKTDSAFREVLDKISKIESVFVKDKNGDNTQESSYTLADVESDIAKIRLGIEKSNKLSNFKEFAARLVELKNINLENAKISRVIGADIMRFDCWLKNTTAKIELLANKIEKSEKIKMEDLKSRIMQSERAQAMPQKLEEAVMSIYKKYRLQETKIDELVNKIEEFSSLKKDTFNIKEFIDLFYDNTQKTQSLISRMDGIEDKMDLIQAKIDHIISSCIDE